MRLNLSPGVEAYRLFGGDIVIHARPALSEVIEEAKADPALLEFADRLQESLEDGTDISPGALKSRGKVGLLLTKAVARLVIDSWEGVEDPDGSPAPVTPDRIDALLDLPPVYDAFTLEYMGRWLTVQAEKNDSAPLPTGTSVAAPNIAKRARRNVRTAPAA